MKSIRFIFVLLFFVILLIPVALFNHQEEAVSEIDNKKLSANPLLTMKQQGYKDKTVQQLTKTGKVLKIAIERYLSERIGLRNYMIHGYTIAHDKLFGEMVHPTYMYGKDGYIFFKAPQPKKYSAFEDAFVHMLTEIQKYCDDRKIPFVFIFEPAKLSVLQDKLPVGYTYDNQWVKTFLNKLKENNINYVDNTEILKQLTKNGIDCFNVKYNAGHWNDMGAFYGMNRALQKLHSINSVIHVNKLEEFKIDQKLNTTLQVSKFPIYEYEPVFSLIEKKNIEEISKRYDKEIERHRQHRYFRYFINKTRMQEKGVRALVFQGSYINGMGYKFLSNSFAEYIGIHDYQNVLNFAYYINIFQPDCILFDVAEYTFTNNYFDYKKMLKFELNPILNSFNNYKVKNIQGKVSEKKGKTLTKVYLRDPGINCDYAYAITKGKEYDMRKHESKDGMGYELTILNEDYNYKDITFVLIDRKNKKKYHIITNI